MICIEEFIFTYADFLEYCNNLPYPETEEEYICVAEDSVEYLLEEETKTKRRTGDKKHDKIFKDILQNKNEMAEFLDYFVGYKISPEELENCNTNYITEGFKYKQTDILYKIKDKNTYILIEHQTKVDYSMVYRILNYCVEIIRNAVDEKNINKVTYKYPNVIPIVLYTGRQRWTAPLEFAEGHRNNEKTDFKSINIKYKLIDINKYELKQLLSRNTMLANVMILERCKDNRDVITCLKEIVENIKNDEQKEDLKRIVIYLYKEINEKSLKEMIKMIEESEREEIMSTISERIGAEFRRERRKARTEGLAEGRAEGIAQGIAESIAQTITNMIKMNFKDEIIKEITGAKESEIQKIRKQMIKV